MRRFLAFPLLLLVVALPASAVDLATNGLVDIIEGITLTQTSGLNFGVVVLDNGSLTILAADGSYTDNDNLVYDNTNISQGIFTIDSTAGVDITVDCAAGTQPVGLILNAFTADWADAGAEGACPQDRTMAAASEVLEIGATLSIDRTTAVVTGGTPADLPYTVSVTFQ